MGGGQGEPCLFFGYIVHTKLIKTFKDDWYVFKNVPLNIITILGYWNSKLIFGGGGQVRQCFISGLFFAKHVHIKNNFKKSEMTGSLQNLKIIGFGKQVAN